MDVKYIVTIQLRWQVSQFLSQAENKWPQVKIEEGLEVKTEKSFILSVGVVEDNRWKLKPENRSSWYNSRE